MKHWTLAFRNLRRNRRRNMATLLAVALGYAGLVLFGGYIARIELFLRTTTVYLQHGGHVAVYAKDGLDKAMARPSRHSLDAEARASILAAASADARVAFATPYLRGMGLAGNGCRTVPFVATGVDPAVFGRILRHPEVLHVSAEFAQPLRGRALPDAQDVEGAVGLAAGLARLLNKPKVHDEVAGQPLLLVPDCGTPEAVEQIAADANIQLAGVTFDGSLSAIDGEIVNLFHTPSTDTEDQTVLTSLNTLQRLYETDAVTYVGVFLHRSGDATAVARDLAATLEANGVSVDAYPFTDSRVNPYYVGSMAFLEALLVFVGILVTTVVVLGVLNSVTLTVYERTREIGTFRALGWRRRQVAALFLREAVILSAAGLLVGLVLALAVATAVNAANIRFQPPGIPGDIPLVLWPLPEVYATVALVLLPLSSLVTWGVVRRRVRERTADLLTATTA
ncbi:MAG: FtsX-like permease family protein [Acidobacteria bacterium]|nr:FtsX-like permease family protein [Acidobacteriota bacterium]